MDQPITEQFFHDLKTRILEAVKPLLTEDELAAFAADIRVSDYGVTSSSLKKGSLISMEITEDIDMDHPTVRFEGLDISEARRGQGIGSAIIRATVDFALENGFEFNLSAHPTDIDIDDQSDPLWIAAQQRLIAYYGRLGMVNDGWGNMHVEINRVEDDYLRARLNNFDIDEAAEQAVAVLQTSLDEVLDGAGDMDAGTMAEKISSTLIDHFREAFTPDSLSAQAREIYGDTPDAGAPVGYPERRTSYLRANTYGRMAELPGFREELARSFSAVGMSIEDSDALVDTVCKTLRLPATSTMHNEPPAALGKVIALRLTSGSKPILKADEPTGPGIRP